MALPYRWQWRVEKWKNTWHSFFGGGEPPRPKLCPACGSLVGVSATRCHQCGASLRFSLAAISKGLSGIFGGAAPVSTALVVINILIFGVSLVTTMQSGQGGGLSILWGLAPDRLTLAGATNPLAIYYGHQWYRLITAMFLHGSLIHIGFNMMVLMDVGPAVEEVYGSARFLFLYISTGVAGFVLSSLRGHSSVGASGAILGLIGLMIAITTKRGGSFMRELRSRLISWVVTIFILGFWLGGLRTDNWAHFGGVAAGFGLGKLFADRQPMNGAEQKRAYALGWLAGIAVVASFVFMLLHFRDTLPAQ